MMMYDVRCTAMFTANRWIGLDHAYNYIHRCLCIQVWLERQRQSRPKLIWLETAWKMLSGHLWRCSRPRTMKRRCSQLAGLVQISRLEQTDVVWAYTLWQRLVIGWPCQYTYRTLLAGSPRQQCIIDRENINQSEVRDDAANCSISYTCCLPSLARSFNYKDVVATQE